AAALLVQALAAVENFRSPRAWAFTLLGLDGYCSSVARGSDEDKPAQTRHLLAERLLSIMSAVETSDWVWFEDGLAYDNARLPQVGLDAGSCRDGLYPDRANENQGGESVVSYLLGLSEIRQLAHRSESRSRYAPRLA